MSGRASSDDARRDKGKKASTVVDGGEIGRNLSVSMVWSMME